MNSGHSSAELVDGAVWKPTRVAIMGASGLTGSGLANQLAQAGICEEVVLFDLKQSLLQAHVIDLREAQIVTGRTATRLTVGSMSEIEEVGEVDLVVIAASLPEKPAGTRADFLVGNLKVVSSLVPAIRQLAGTAGLVMVLTNPADVLATVLAEMSGIAPDRVFGYCLNDSIRLAAAVSRELNVDPADVDALVLGEHGDGQVPMYSRLTVRGVSVSLTSSQRARIDEDARNWFRRWSDLEPGRSSGWTTPVGALSTIDRLARGVSVPVAVWTAGMAGLRPTHVTLPSLILDRRVSPDLTQMHGEEWGDVVAAASSLASRAHHHTPAIAADQTTLA